MSTQYADDTKKLDDSAPVAQTFSREHPGAPAGKHTYDEELTSNPSGLPYDIDEKKLIRKIDMKVIPWLSFLYLLSFLDRGAIGNAKIYGLQPDLGLTSNEYTLCLTVFFPIPSNILLKKLRPHIWFSAITVLVGICMSMQGIVQNFGGLLGARFALGLTEAGLFPGANYLLAGWYRRNEMGKRTAIFFSAATLAGAFGGLVSYALNLVRLGDYEGWRSIFIFIGIVTLLAGVLSFWLYTDFPETASFLTEKERSAVIWRLQQDQQFSAAGETFRMQHVWRGILDWKTCVAMLVYGGVCGPLYVFSLFTPTILRELGYTANRANLTSIPIYAVACLLTVAVGFLADKTSRRSYYNVGLGLVAIVGYAILLGNDLTERPGLSYFACYLAAAGIYPSIPNTISLFMGNSEGSYTRAVVTAMVISFGNLNGAATSNIYPARTGPRFQMGHGVVIGYLTLSIASALVYHHGVMAENAKREAGLRDERILALEMTEEEQRGRDLVAEAERIREEEMKQAGWWRRVQYGLHLQSGGTYATVDEAKKLKGDNWSGFRYRS